MDNNPETVRFPSTQKQNQSSYQKLFQPDFIGSVLMTTTQGTQSSYFDVQSPEASTIDNNSERGRVAPLQMQTGTSIQSIIVKRFKPRGNSMSEIKQVSNGEINSQNQFLSPRVFQNSSKVLKNQEDSRKKNLTTLITQQNQQNEQLSMLPKLSSVIAEGKTFSGRVNSILQIQSQSNNPYQQSQFLMQSPTNQKSQTIDARNKRLLLANNFLDELQQSSNKLLPQITERSQKTIPNLQSLPKLDQPTPEINQETELNEEFKIPNQLIEEWLNTVLKINPEDKQLLPRPVETHSDQVKTASQTYGIDVPTLIETGISAENARRIHRCLYVHSTGFHLALRDNLRNCKNKHKTLGKIWVAYQRLLEQCVKSSYNVLVYNLQLEAETELINLKDKYKDVIQAEQQKVSQLNDDLAKIQREYKELQQHLERSQQDCASFEETIVRFKEMQKEESVMRLQSEKNMADLFSNSRMQDLKIKQFQKVATESQEEAQKLKAFCNEQQKKILKLDKKIIELEQDLRNQHSDKEMLRTKFKIDMKEYSNTKAEVILLKERIADLIEEKLDTEKQFQLMRLETEYLRNDNAAQMKTTQTYKTLLEDNEAHYESKMSMLNGNSSQYEAMKEEYFQFRQKNLNSEIQIKDLTKVWKQTEIQLEAEKNQVKSLEVQLKAAILQNEKLEARSNTLIKEQSQIAQNVHTYYSAIDEVDRKLQAEIKLNELLQKKLLKKKEKFKKFMELDFSEKVRECQSLNVFLEKIQIKLAREESENLSNKQAFRLEIQDLKHKCESEKEQKQIYQEDLIRTQNELGNVKTQLFKEINENTNSRLSLQKQSDINQQISIDLKSTQVQFAQSQKVMQILKSEKQEVERLLAMEKTTTQQVKETNQKLVDQILNDMKTITEPFLKQLEVNAMIGEDYRSRSLKNFEKVNELLNQIDNMKKAGMVQAKQYKRLENRQETYHQKMVLRVEALYEQQRIKERYIASLFEIIKQKDDEIAEHLHENTRLVRQTLEKKGQVLKQHLTLNFSQMTSLPKSIDAVVQNCQELKNVGCDAPEHPVDSEIQTQMKQEDFWYDGKELKIRIFRTCDKREQTDPIPEQVKIVERIVEKEVVIKEYVRTEEPVAMQKLGKTLQSIDLIPVVSATITEQDEDEEESYKIQTQTKKSDLSMKSQQSQPKRQSPPKLSKNKNQNKLKGLIISAVSRD